MLLELAQRAPLQAVNWSSWQERGVDVSIWRLDQLDAAAPGNKLFKLAENLQMAKREGHSRILSFGGAFSNHIHALALAGRAAGFETIGIIRGEASAIENPTLRDAAAAGMQLHFVSRGLYREFTQKSLPAKDSIDELERRFGPCYIIPEGGANRLGVLGCRALGMAIGGMRERPDTVILPCATGSTLAGIVAGLENNCAALGIAVLKGGNFIAEQVRDYLRDIEAEHCTQWRIDLDHHCGGYARASARLLHFVTQFSGRTGIGVEPVYSGKMLYAIERLIERGEFAPGTRILAVHTGGMQGARGAPAIRTGS
jgi:1-aminocyclopropane-1-carboxylate deaminase